MKKRIKAMMKIAAAGIAAMSLCAFGNENQKTEYEDLYRPVTDAVYQYLFTFSEEEDSSAFGRLGEVVYSIEERTDALRSVGYCIKDISGDGVPELLIGVTASNQGDQVSADLYAVYILENDTPKLADSSFAGSQYSPAEMTPFSKYYRYALRLADSEEAAAQDSDNNTEKEAPSEGDAAAEHVLLSEGDAAAEYALLCRETVKNVKVYRLSLEEISAEGEAVYTAEEVYTRTELGPDDRIVLQMELPELFPICGISYEDESGIHQLAVYESGRDGLVYLDEASWG